STHTPLHPTPPLSLHDALPIYPARPQVDAAGDQPAQGVPLTAPPHTDAHALGARSAPGPGPDVWDRGRLSPAGTRPSRPPPSPPPGRRPARVPGSPRRAWSAAARRARPSGPAGPAA